MATTKKKMAKRSGRHRSRLAELLPELDFKAMSPMGRELVRLSAEIEESGEGLLNEKEIELEIARRRGGYIPTMGLVTGAARTLAELM
jgi:hypothetical protein